MTNEEAINVLNDYDINFERNTPEEVAEAHEMAIEALKTQPSEDYAADLNGRSAEEIAEAFDVAIKSIQTIPSEEEKVIRIKKGTLKARTGRYVVCDVEWLKTHFNTTEAKIYGQQQPSERTEERTETHECDCISRQLMYDMGATCIAARNKDGDLVALGALDILPSVTPQPKTEEQAFHVMKGHWEWVQYESKPNFGNWHCSECRHILCGAIKGNPVKLPNYCEECGSYNGGTK